MMLSDSFSETKITSHFVTFYTPTPQNKFIRSCQKTRMKIYFNDLWRQKSAEKDLVKILDVRYSLDLRYFSAEAPPIETKHRRIYWRTVRPTWLPTFNHGMTLTSQDYSKPWSWWFCLKTWIFLFSQNWQPKFHRWKPFFFLPIGHQEKFFAPIPPTFAVILCACYWCQSNSTICPIIFQPF